jgi:hypothetical protein
MTEIYKTAGAALMVALIGLFPAIPASSAEQPPAEMKAKKEVGQEVREAVDAIKESSADQRDAAVKKGKALLDNLDLRIERMESNLKKNWDKMEESSRKKTKASLEAAKKQREKIAERFRSLKESTAGAWEGVKKGFVESYQALHDSFDNIEEKF